MVRLLRHAAMLLAKLKANGLHFFRGGRCSNSAFAASR